MLLVLGALVAGALTTLAPCVLPMLPVIVGGSIAGPDRDARRRAYLITASLGASVVVFTLLLRATTALIGVPTAAWQWLSGSILLALGLASAFPGLWEAVSARLALQGRSVRRLERAVAREGTAGAVLTGAALGPVFTSCSPLYGYVIVTVLPASLGTGLVLLLAYAVGLTATLLVVALLGQRAIGRARWVADAHGPVRRGLGWVFILVAVAVIAGWDKDLQTWVVENATLRPWDLDARFIPG
ncbi:MAG: hypothetical protein RLZZ272_898 [Actinomycetota bacterium]|jgi:cytochrome c biogenesis protein CcdA